MGMYFIISPPILHHQSPFPPPIRHHQSFQFSIINHHLCIQFSIILPPILYHHLCLQFSIIISPPIFHHPFTSIFHFTSTSSSFCLYLSFIMAFFIFIIGFSSLLYYFYYGLLMI